MFCTRLSWVAPDAVLQQAMRHGSPEAKRFYQLGLAHQIRKHLEELNQRAYEGRPPLRFRDRRNRNGNPDQHLLSDLQTLAERAGAQFAVELHKLRKTGASRRYLAGVPMPTLMLELGHESLATTQRYLADVRKPSEAKKAVADADFIPKPKLAKTGTDGD